MISRREFLKSLGLFLAAASVPALAQSPSKIDWTAWTQVELEAMPKGLIRLRVNGEDCTHDTAARAMMAKLVRVENDGVCLGAFDPPLRVLVKSPKDFAGVVFRFEVKTDRGFTYFDNLALDSRDGTILEWGIG